ncbi:MAG: PEGA domain-containing protein [Pirellulaceae bacterium]|nr:PEGA domain-containing protein [Pirellulaceae bacterium]
MLFARALSNPAFRLFMLGLAGLLLQSGCARRQMQINSFPEGAAVSVDHQPVGYTPVAVPFHYNGTREILIEKDGFKTVRVKQPISGPWYFSAPFSFFTDNFATREVRDSQRFNFQLEPVGQINDQQLTDRAENLRGQVLQGSITPSMQRDQYIWETR